MKENGDISRLHITLGLAAVLVFVTVSPELQLGFSSPTGLHSILCHHSAFCVGPVAKKGGQRQQHNQQSRMAGFHYRIVTKASGAVALLLIDIRASMYYPPVKVVVGCKL